MSIDYRQLISSVLFHEECIIICGMANNVRNLNLHETKDLRRNVFLVIHLFEMAFKEVDSLCDKKLLFLLFSCLQTDSRAISGILDTSEIASLLSLSNLFNKILRSLEDSL